MPAFKITAYKDCGQIKKGFEFMVNTGCSNPSNAIKEYLTKMGYNQSTISFYSSGSWKVEKLG